MYKLFLTLRYLRKRRIAYFAIAAVVMCTAMVLIVMSVMGGFLDQLKSKARNLLGDIIVDNSSANGFPLYQEFIDDVAKWPEIVRATPVIYSYGLLRFADYPQTNTVQVVGLRLSEVYDVNAFKASLYYEKYYPGTTTLAPQQQPVLGFEPRSAPEPNDPDLLVRWPVLPAPYAEARERSYRAGLVTDDDSAPNMFADFFAGLKAPSIVGEYAFPHDPLPSRAAPALVGDALPGLIIGRDIVASRRADGTYERLSVYPRGCLVSLTLPPPSEVDTPPKAFFRYADDSRTGIYEIDSKHVYCDFELLQKILHFDETERIDPDTGQRVGVVPARCSQIQIRIRAGVDPNAIAEKLEEHYLSFLDSPRFADRLRMNEAKMVMRVRALTWEQSQAHIIAPVENERQLVTILFGIISLVAGLLVLCILYMIVLQKTRDIGIVKAIGGSPLGVAAVFLSYGAAIGIVGSTLGAALGYGFVRNIQKVQDFLIWQFNWRVWDRSVYSFDEIPNTVRTADLVTVVIVAIFLSTLGALLAARRAGLMQPVEALRHE